VDILSFQLDEAERWLLMLFRIGGMVMIFPLYGYAAVPTQVRAGFAFLLTSVLFPLHTGMALHLAPGIITFFGIVLKEIVIGIALGMTASFLFYGVQLAGHVIGYSMGFGIINVLDPDSQIQIPILAQLLNMFALLLFIIINGHHFLLMAIDETFLRIPLGGGVFTAPLVEGFARLSADIFTLGIKIGAPVLVAILVTEFALGILARTVPQMNVWIIGFPLKIGIGLLTMALALPFFVFVFGKYYAGWQGQFVDFIRAMAG